MSLSKEVREGASLRERSKVNWNATTPAERHKRLASAIIVAEGFVPQNYTTLEELKNVRKTFNQLLRVVKGDFQERRVLNDMACGDVDRHFDRYPETFVYHSDLWFKKEQAVFPLWCARRDCDMDLAILHNSRDGLWRAIKWREWEIKNERWVRRCAKNTGVRAFSEPRLVRVTNDQVDDEKPRGRSKSVVGIRGGALPIDAGRDGRGQRLDTLLVSANTFLPSSCITLREINSIHCGFNEKLGPVKNHFKARKVLLAMHWKELEEHWEQVPEAKVHYSEKRWEKQRAFGPLWGVQRDYDRVFARVVIVKDVLHCALDNRAWEIIDAFRRATEAARSPWSRAYSVSGTSGVTEEKKDDEKPRGISKSVAGLRGGALSTNDDGDECVEESGSEADFSAAEDCNHSTSDVTSEHFATAGDCHDDSDHADDIGEYDTASEGANSITGPTRSLRSISSAAETVIPYYTTVAQVDEAIVEARKIFNEQALAIGAENGSSLRRYEQYLKHFWFSPGDALKLRKLEYNGLRKRLERLNNDYLNEFAALVWRRDKIVATEARTTEAQVEIAFAEFEKSDDISSTVVEVGRSISPPVADIVNLGEYVSLLPIRGGDLSLRTDDEYQYGNPIYTTDLEDTDAIDISLSWPEQSATIRATGYTTVVDVDVVIAKARQVLMSGRRVSRTPSIESRSLFAQTQSYTAPRHNYGPARGERFLLFNHQITFLVKQSVLLRRRNKLLDAEANSAEAPLRGGDLSLRTNDEYPGHPDAIKVFLAWPEETAPGLYSACAACATVSHISAALTQGRKLLWQAIQEIRAQSFWFAQAMRNLIPTKQERGEWCKGHNHYHRQLRFLQSTFLMKQGVLLKKRAEPFNAEANSAGSSLRGGAFDDWSDISPSPTISESSSPDTAADCGEYTIALAEVDEAITGARKRMRAHIMSLRSLNNSTLQHVSDLEKERKMDSTQAVFGHWSRLVVHRGYRRQLLELQKRHLLELGKLLMSRNYLIEAWNKGPEFESGPVERAKRNYSSMAAVEMPQYRALLPAPMPWKVGAPVVVTIRGGGLSSDSGSEDEENKATTIAEVDKAMARAREVLRSLVSDTPVEYPGAGFPPASLIHRRIRLIRRRVWRSRRLRKNRDYHKALVVLRGTERKLHDKTCERLSRLLGFHVDSNLTREAVGRLLEDREREILAPSEAIRLSRAQAEEKEAAEGRTLDLPIRGGALFSPESSDSDSSQDYNTIAEVEEAIFEARALLREQLSAVESRNFASHVRHAQEERRINDERHIRNFERDEAITRIGDIRDLEKQAYEKEKEHLNRLHKEKEADLQKRLEELLALAKAKTEKPPVAPKDSEMEAAVASVADLEDPESISFSPAEPVVKLPRQTKKAGDESPPVAGLRGGAGSVFQEVLEENEQHFLDADLAPSSGLSEGLEKATAEHADGVFRVSSSSASPTIRVEQRDGDSWKGERVALLSSGGVSKSLEVINNAHVEVKSDDVFNVGSFFSAKEETPQPAEFRVASTDWYRPLAEFQYPDHCYEEPQPGINVGSDGAASLVPYSSPVVSDTSTEIEAKREAYNLKESDSDGWCYLTPSGIIGRFGVKDVPAPPVALDHVPGRGFFPRQTEDRPLILPKQAEQRMEDPVLAALAAAHEQGCKAWKSEPIVNEWADGMSSHENVQDPFSAPFADAEEGYDSIPSQPIGDIITTAVSAKTSTSEKSVSLTTSAFLRNIRRCARYVKDTVKHDRHWLPLDDEVQYCRSPRLLHEDGAFEPDSESDNEPAMKSVFNLTNPPSPRISEELDRKLEASLTESAKAARCKTRTGMGRFQNGKLSFRSLSKHMRNTLPVISKSQKKYFARKESLSSDDFDSLLEDAASAMNKEGISRFVKKWNDYAHTHGFWHTKSDKAAQPPFELIPPAIRKLNLQPAEEVGVDDAFQGGTTALDLCDSNRFVEDPYDTEDFDRSNLIGIVQRVDQMKKKYWSKEMRARKEREMKEGEDFDSYFKRVYPSVKRAKSEPKLSPRVQAEEAEDHFSMKRWTGRAPNDVAEGLRGGSLDEAELETSTSLRATPKHGRMSLLADDGLWQSLKRKSKWQAGISFIDAGPPPLEHPMKRQKPYNPAQRSSPLRHQPPIPHFPPSPPRTPPPPPLPTSPEEPAYFWSLPEIPLHSKKFDPIRLNAEFVPWPRTGDFDKFCALNTKTLGDMGRTFIAKRRQAGKIRTHKHCLISATHRRDSACELVEEWLETAFPDGPIKYTKERKRRDSGICVVFEEG